MLELFFADERSNKGTIVQKLFNGLIVLLFLTGIFVFAFQSVMYHWGWDSIYPYRAKFFQGWVVTLIISILSLVLSLVIGLILALSKRSRFLPLRYATHAYVESIRSSPLLVQILIFFYVVATALHFNSRFFAGVIILALFEGAYICEIIRAGIEGIGKSQLETAKAIGLTKSQTYRYVIFPQAFRHILPALTGQFVSLVKDSSLLSIISVNEFTLNAREVNSFTYSTLECYIPLAVGYWIITVPISLLSKRLEEKVRYET